MDDDFKYLDDRESSAYFEDPEQSAVRNRKIRNFASSSLGKKERSSSKRSAWGELEVAEAYWWNSPIEMSIKIALFVIYVAMGTTSIAFAIPLAFNVAANPIFFFVLTYFWAFLSICTLIIALIDSTRLGLSFTGPDPIGRIATVSFRDRMFHIILPGAAAAINLFTAITWTIWYAYHSDLNDLAEFDVFSHAVGQYYGLLGASLAIYMITPFIAFTMIYTNTRYKFGVYLADAIVRKITGKSVDDLLNQDVENTGVEAGSESSM